MSEKRAEPKTLGYRESVRGSLIKVLVNHVRWGNGGSEVESGKCQVKEKAILFAVAYC